MFYVFFFGLSCALTVLAETVVRLRLQLPPPCLIAAHIYICPARRKRRNLGYYSHLMPNASVNAPKQIRTASVTSVKASAQAYEQSIFRRLWEKKASRKVKLSGTPTLVNFTRKDSTSLDPEVRFVNSSSDPEACPGGLPLATSTPLLHQNVTMASSSSSLQQLTQAAGSLLGIGVQGVTPLPTDVPLPQRSPRKTGQHSQQLITLDSPAPGTSGQGNGMTGVQEQDSQMDSQQSCDIAGSKEVLDVTVVSTASDWPDNVFFDSTRPSGSLPQHLQLTGGVPLPPEDSLRPTIVARRSLPPGLPPKPDLASKFAVKRNLPFGSPLKSAKSEGGTLSEMDSSDGGAGKPDKPVLTTVRKKKRRAVVDPATIQLIIDQLKEATLVSETHQSNTIAALNSAMRRYHPSGAKLSLYRPPKARWPALWIRPHLGWPSVSPLYSTTHSNSTSSMIATLGSSLSGTPFSRSGPTLRDPADQLRRVAMRPRSFSGECSN